MQGQRVGPRKRLGPAGAACDMEGAGRADVNGQCTTWLRVASGGASCDVG